MRKETGRASGETGASRRWKERQFRKSSALGNGYVGKPSVGSSARSSPWHPFRSTVRWPLLAAVVLFLVHDRLTGVPSGGAPVGGVAGAAVLAGHILFRSFPDLPLVAKYAALTGITMLLAIPATRMLSTMVFGVTTTDPWTYAAVAALLLAVGIATSAIPAWRAARIDPTQALRIT